MKSLRAQEGKVRYVLGCDIYVESLCSRDLVGRLEYCHMGKKEWTAWEMEHWKPLHLCTYYKLASKGLVFFLL